MITTRNRAGQTFSTEDLGLLKDFATHAEIALKIAKTLTQNESALRLVEQSDKDKRALLTMVKTITSELDLRAVIRDDHVQAFAHQERACTCFQSVFEKDSAWSLPVLHVLDLGLRRAAQRADAQLASRGEKRCKLEEAARTLQKSFQYTVRAAATPSPSPTPAPAPNA